MVIVAVAGHREWCRSSSRGIFDNRTSHLRGNSTNLPTAVHMWNILRMLGNGNPMSFASPFVLDGRRGIGRRLTKNSSAREGCGWNHWTCSKSKGQGSLAIGCTETFTHFLLRLF